VILCLNCRKLWPTGTVYCGQCGRSFDGRLCPKGHRSPASSDFCLFCGDTKLSQSTPSVQLGWLTRAGGCVVLLLIVRLTVTFGWRLLVAAASLFGVLFGCATGESPLQVLASVLQFACPLGIFVFFWAILRLKQGKDLKPIWLLYRHTGNLLWRITRFSWTLILRFIVGTDRSSRGNQ